MCMVKDNHLDAYPLQHLLHGVGQILVDRRVPLDVRSHIGQKLIMIGLAGASLVQVCRVDISWSVSSLIPG